MWGEAKRLRNFMNKKPLSTRKKKNLSRLYHVVKLSLPVRFVLLWKCCFFNNDIMVFDVFGISYYLREKIRLGGKGAASVEQWVFLRLTNSYLRKISKIQRKLQKTLND